ncbi:TATA element modulatory factor [Lepisosteus oculatus]|uniref:TATA element modulatory factor n=1 Tax=Lepisosteus oculatus TaxID=7918 RepID=UPI003716AF82
MSWFNASQLSSFAKQALTTAQKSIDRVLDIKEEDQWGDTVLPSYDDLPGKTSFSSEGWSTSQWNSPLEKCSPAAPASTEAITTPVTRTVVDESENFFSAFLQPAEPQNVKNSQVVSVPPAKSPRPEEEKPRTVASKENLDPLKPGPVKPGKLETKKPVASKPVSIELAKPAAAADTGGHKPDPESSLPQKSTQETAVCVTDGKNQVELLDGTAAVSEVTKAEKSPSLSGVPVEDGVVNGSCEGTPPESPSKPHLPPSKEMLLESKDPKSEDRQSNTPSPPVSTFSSGTSTTSDIEVLDHESVLSESSASSRQENAESKAGLHLMQTSFQLLSASACADFPRLDDYQKLTESCGSSDAFERIDSFSVQSLDSRSVSELNSDDELSGRACTLASIATGPAAPHVAPADQDEQRSEEELMETPKDKSLEDSEMEESGRSATPVNCEPAEELVHPESARDGSSSAMHVKETVPFHLASEEKSEVSNYQLLELQKTIDELTNRLEKREIQLLAVSKDKARLEEEHDNLKDEMISLKEESSGVQALKEEFTQRIADAEKKAQLACKERDAMKKDLKALKEELSMRLNSNETAEIMREKDEQIKGLLEEGEKLSKQQLHSSNIIKKLRTKEKENENLTIKQNRRIKELEEELRHLQEVLDGKEEVEKQHRENIKKLNSMVEKQERELSRLQTDIEEFQERSRSLQAALDSSYKELAELHRANATRDSEAQEAALSREIQAKEQLSLALEKAQEESRTQQEALALQVADLRLALQRAEQQQARKEDYLREEISELQQRLQAAETRNQELSQSVTSATRPLLRQIENLQATLGAQTSSWEKLEKNISDRLVDAQAQLAVAVEKERSAAEDLLSFKAQLASVESQNSLLRQEKGRLQVLLDSEKSKREKLEDDSSREHAELQNLKGEYARALEEYKKEKVLLNNQLEMEKMKVEQEKKKYFLVQEALKEKERKAYSHPVADPSASGTPSLSRSSSISGVDLAGLQNSFYSQDDSFDHSFGTLTMSASGSNLYEAVRMGAGSSIIENLQSQLKLREGEIMQLQLEISNLEKTRAVMSEELVKLTNQNDELEEKVKEIPKLRLQLRDLDQRYNTILQMYGEKAEEAEELRLDLEDVKNMYKTQIDELLKTKK